MPSASDPRQQNRTRRLRRALLSLGQRPAQPTQRSAQPAQRAAQQPAARPAQPAGGARFKQQAPAQRTQGQARHHAPTHIMLMARTALLRPRARAITRMPAVASKRKALRCL